MVDTTTTTDESWETSSGLVEEYTIDIQDAFFGTDARYNQGQSMLLQLAVKTDIEDRPEETLLITIGNGWETLDGGKTAVRENGKTPKFVQNTHYGLWINRVLTFEDAAALLKARGNPTNAEIWKGLKFHVKREPINYGSGLAPQVKLLPDEFLGESDVAGSSPASSSAPAAVPASGVNVKAIEAKLKMLAKKADSHGDFVDAALSVDGLTDDDNLLAQVVDDGADGFYLKNH